MKASLLYRISSILLVLFAIGHTLGFRQIDPTWGVDSLVQSMKSIHFNANGPTVRIGTSSLASDRSLCFRLRSFYVSAGLDCLS